jgi:hypothetical protein
MADRPVELDQHRGMSAQKATEERRERQDVAASEAALQGRRDELEAAFVAAPAEGWPELARKLRYLIELFAATAEAQDERRQKLIASVLDDLTRLAGADGAPT